MTVIYSSDYYSNIVHVSDDVIDIRESAVLTVGVSTQEIGQLSASSPVREVHVVNSSVETPIFFKTNGAKVSIQGALKFNGALIAVGESTGLAGQTFNLPFDANGEAYNPLGGVVVEYNGEQRFWACVDSLVNIFDDERGRLFTQDVVANTITFGSGGGAIVPVGAIIKVPNIQWKCNASQLDISGGDLVVEGAVDVHRIKIGAAGRVTSTGFLSFSDPLGRIDFSDVEANYVSALCVSGVLGSDVRVRLGKGVYDDVFVVSNNGSVAECITDQSNRVDVGVLTGLFLMPRAGGYARIQMGLNGGTVGVLNAFCGDRDFSFSGADGAGIINQFNYSCRSRPVQAGIYGTYLFRRLSNGLKVLKTRCYGNDAHTLLERFIDNRAGKNIVLEDVETPHDFNCKRFCDVEIDASLTLKKSKIYGEITDATSRTLDTSSSLGTTFLDVWFEDDDVANEAGDNMRWVGVNLNGNVPRLGRNTPLVQSYDNANRLTGYVATRPSLIESNAQIVGGDVADVVDKKSRFYATSTNVRLRWVTGLWFGVTAIVDFLVDGYAFNSNWLLQFRMRTARGAFEGDFITATELSLKSAFDTLVDYDSNEGAELQFEAQRIAGTPNDAIYSVAIAVVYDEGYEFNEPGAVISVSAPLIVPSGATSAAVLVNVSAAKTLDRVAALSSDNHYVSRPLLEGIDYTQGDTLELRGGWQLGFSCSKKYSVRFVAGEVDLVAADGFESHPFYADLKIDGNAMNDYLSVVSGQVKLNIDDVDGDGYFDPRGVPAWYYNLLSTPLGLEGYFHIADLVSETEFVLNVNVPLDNTGEKQIKLKNPVRDAVQPMWIRSADPYFDFIGHDHSGGRGISYNVGKVYSALPVAPSAQELISAMLNTQIQGV